MAGFAKIPLWIFPMEISSNAKILYAYLDNAQRMNGEIRMPIDMLAEGIHVSRHTIQRSLKELEEENLIRISRQFSNAIPKIQVLENESCQANLAHHDRQIWHDRQANLARPIGKFGTSDRQIWHDTIPYIKEINKRNNKRTAKSARARAWEEQTYDMDIFRQSKKG